MTGPHEQAALDALVEAATPNATHKDASINDAACDVIMAQTLEQAQSAFVALVVAVEGYGEAMKDAARQVIASADDTTRRVRDVLLESLSESSGWARNGIHTASVGTGRPGVVITDEDAIPPEYLRTKTEPNRDAIGRAIRAGEVVPGATLRNSAPLLRITTKADTRAA